MQTNMRKNSPLSEELDETNGATYLLVTSDARSVSPEMVMERERERDYDHPWQRKGLFYSIPLPVPQKRPFQVAR